LMARSTSSMARLTPIQKPAVRARITFKSDSPLKLNFQVQPGNRIELSEHLSIIIT
jgi:hypothetical protein